MPGLRTRCAYTYDWRGNKLTETDQLGRVTKHGYDLAGQLSSTTVAFGTADAATTSYTYDPAGRRLTITDPRGNVTTSTYDDGGRLTSVEDGVHNVTTFGYNAKGERTSMTDAKSRTTTYTYDSRGRQLVTTTPDTKTVTKTYDGLGLVLTTTDEENRTTTFEYDAASQLTAVIDALSQRTEYAYDPAGNKLTQKDARNDVTHYAYDDLNRRVTRTLPLNQVESYTYNAIGNMATHVDFNGKTTTYAYHNLNRLLNRTPDASFSAPTVSFTYTNAGQRATMTDASGTTTYTYSNRDQVLTKATPQGTLTYTYDLAGNVASVTSSNANGTSVTYAYDANNRLQSVTDARTSGVTSYTYDATNQLDTFTYANGVMHDYSYDNRDRMTGLSVTKSGVLASYTQTFSDTGRKLTAAENSGRTATYGYDSIYRLLTETITSDPVTANNGSLTYTLDAVGNRSTLASTLAALSTQSFTYDNNDRISGDTFDSNGNTTVSGGVTYTYDFEDRLLTTSSGVVNVYDGDGNRISRTVGGVTTKFLVDEHNPTGWPQVTEETVSGAVTAQYTHGLMRASQKRGATVSYYGYDAGGSVRQLYDTSGVVTDTYAYDAFGNTVAQTGSTVNLYQYRGEQYDASLQMYYLRVRWYRPQTGRFVTQDTYEGDDEEPLSLHDYLYAHADPVDGIDPSGFANTVENSFVSRLGNIVKSVFADFSTGMRGVTLGRVRAGAKLAYDTICCLDKAWSVLDVALTTVSAFEGVESFSAYESSPTHVALRLIDAACKLKCPPPKMGQPVYRIFGGKSRPYGESWSPVHPDSIGRGEWRDVMGVGEWNTGEWLLTGTLKSLEGITARSALQIPGRSGGGCEYVIKDSASKILGGGLRRLVPPF